MKFRAFFIVSFSCLSVLGCSWFGQARSVQREDLFVLDIGMMEDQIALFNFDSSRGIRPTDLAMRDGLFYISDGSGGRVLRFNSYGDLLFMIYNEETNPPPLTLMPLVEGSMVTRWAVTHPLLEPGEIIVDSRSHIFVRDRLPYERRSFDPESGVLLENVVLHFDADGRFIDYLGREGIGGTPFPIIEGIFTSVGDELVVVCRLLTGWNIYWYDPDGFFLFVVRLENSAIPIPPDREDVIPSLDTISVSPDARRLFIKVDYYRHIYDGTTNARIGIEPDSSVIWIMNAETGVWERYVELPFFEHATTAQNRRLVSRAPYSLIGIARNERAFLSFPVEGGYSILVVSLAPGTLGQQRRGFIEVDNRELLFNAFDLSPEGILSGLLADDWQVTLVWWRTDRFFEV
ncbi:MAG: hypothetical protein FWC64_12475 [Treponema sp.]|nr:hypothetical protein [Treponema sp.]